MTTPTLNPRITLAGLALFPSPVTQGFQVQLTHVALGTAKYTPAVDAQGRATQTGLQAEFARFPITSGMNPSPRQVQVGATITDADPQGRSTHAKEVGEIGFYAGDTLFAIWSQPTNPLFIKSDSFDVPLAYTLDISILPANAVTIAPNMGDAGLSHLILQHENKADPHGQYKPKISGILTKGIAGAAGASLTSIEAGHAILVFTGLLAANSTVIVPNENREWIVFNNTTGPHTLTIKTAGGAGVNVTQGRTMPVWCDSVSVRSGMTETSDASMIGLFPRTTAPAGWLKANGAVVSVEAYPNLAANLYVGDANNATASFGYRCTNASNPTASRSINGAFIVLPDLRGEFPRFLDDGRGIDPNRAMGSTQDSQNLAHTHSASADTQGWHGHSGVAHSAGYHNHGVTVHEPDDGSTGPAFASDNANDPVNYAYVDGAGAHTHTLGIDGNGSHSHNITLGSNGGTEARPRNIAMLACIKF